MALVKALRMGYYKNKRIREGVVFEIEDKLLKFNDKKVLSNPMWVSLVQEDEPKQKQVKKEITVKDDDVI